MGVGQFTLGTDTFPLEVASDLSSDRYKLCKLSSGYAVKTDTKGEACLGVLQEAVDGSSEVKTGAFRCVGILMIKLGGTVSALAQLVANTDGTAITDDAANQFVVGIALTAGVSGDIIPMKAVFAPTTTS